MFLQLLLSADLPDPSQTPCNLGGNCPRNRPDAGMQACSFWHPESTPQEIPPGIDFSTIAARMTSDHFCIPDKTHKHGTYNISGKPGALYIFNNTHGWNLSSILRGEEILQQIKEHPAFVRFTRLITGLLKPFIEMRSTLFDLANLWRMQNDSTQYKETLAKYDKMLEDNQHLNLPQQVTAFNQTMIDAVEELRKVFPCLHMLPLDSTEARAWLNPWITPDKLDETLHTTEHSKTRRIPPALVFEPSYDGLNPPPNTVDGRMGRVGTELAEISPSWHIMALQEVSLQRKPDGMYESPHCLDRILPQLPPEKRGIIWPDPTDEKHPDVSASVILYDTLQYAYIEQPRSEEEQFALSILDSLKSICNTLMVCNAQPFKTTGAVFRDRVSNQLHFALSLHCSYVAVNKSGINNNVFTALNNIFKYIPNFFAMGDLNVLEGNDPLVKKCMDGVSTKSEPTPDGTTLDHIFRSKHPYCIGHLADLAEQLIKIANDCQHLNPTGGVHRNHSDDVRWPRDVQKILSCSQELVAFMENKKQEPLTWFETAKQGDWTAFQKLCECNVYLPCDLQVLSAAKNWVLTDTRYLLQCTQRAMPDIVKAARLYRKSLNGDAKAKAKAGKSLFDLNDRCHGVFDPLLKATDLSNVPDFRWWLSSD